MEVHSNNRCNFNPSVYLLGGMFVLHIMFNSEIHANVCLVYYLLPVIFVV